MNDQITKPDHEQDEAIHLHIRWLTRRDMPEALDIERGCFADPWSEEDFIRCLRQRNCIGMAAEHDDQVVGFMIYELTKKQIDILNFAVRSDLHGKTIGTQMVDKLKSKLSYQRRTMIYVWVRETNLDAQLFFKAQGFSCMSISREHYGSDEDAYGFRFGIEMVEGEQ